MYAVKITFMSGPYDGHTEWLKSNENRGHAIVKGWAFVIGRSESCDLTIYFDTQVSREHAQVQVFDDHLQLVDNDSRNGTFIGQARVQKTSLLRLNELFRVGQTWFKIEDVQR